MCGESNARVFFWFVFFGMRDYMCVSCTVLSVERLAGGLKMSRGADNALEARHYSVCAVSAPVYISKKELNG